ncbi:MAG TPA: hypothetical protein PKJ55_09270 [Novosphingobium sp.]|nr:hypothetical protein [Novosphingobium sp.]HPZ46933.1 hypothetical protein [Novosphingobium sp.]HQD98995.1 hypothetical protein [Novosphingobium sp.]
MKGGYIDHVLASYLRSTDFDAQVGDGWIFYDTFDDIARDTVTRAFSRYGIEVNPNKYREYFKRLFDDLASEEAITFEGDDYSDLLFQINFAKKNQILSKILQANLASQRIEKLGSSGPAALDRALKKIAFEDGNIDQDLNEIEDVRDNEESFFDKAIPASNRVVKLDHNQVAQFDVQVSELIDHLEVENGDPDNPGLRERLLGQIKAGRELIRAGEFKAYLLYEVLVRALGELIEKYGNPTIKALADALLGAVVSRILEG